MQSSKPVKPDGGWSKSAQRNYVPCPMCQAEHRLLIGGCKTQFFDYSKRQPAPARGVRASSLVPSRRGSQLQRQQLFGAGEMSLDEIVKALLELLKIAAWPALIAWLVWYLRDEVKRAATRITEL